MKNVRRVGKQRENDGIPVLRRESENVGCHGDLEGEVGPVSF
jgi:hypothetical protein